jgi:sugar porter (SP) family MFS transporter
MRSKNAYVYLIAAFSALGGLLFGYDTGVISGSILFIKQEFALTSFQIELVISAALLGCVIGASCGGFLSDKFGRRKVLLFAAFLFTAASILTALAINAAWLEIGRIFVGMAIGISSMIVPLYIAEIAPASIRGRLVSLNQLALTSGIVVSYLVDYAFAESGSWRWMLGVAAIPSIVFGIGMFFLPETPRWLYKKGRTAEAYRILAFAQGRENVEREMAEIKNSLLLARQRQLEVIPRWLKRALVVGIGLAIFQQLTGINTIIYYAPLVFEAAGFKTAQHAILATVIIGIVNVMATIVAFWLLDKVGRRILLLIGLVGMIVSLGILGFCFQFSHLSNVLAWLTLVSLIFYIASFAISLGPVFWLLISEIYPLSIRGKAMSVATVFNWAFNLFVSLTFLTLVDLLGLAGTFWFYGLLGIAAWLFSYFLVPETKNKTLEQIEKELMAVRE